MWTRQLHPTFAGFSNNYGYVLTGKVKAKELCTSRVAPFFCRAWCTTPTIWKEGNGQKLLKKNVFTFLNFCFGSNSILSKCTPRAGSHQPNFFRQIPVLLMKHGAQRYATLSSGRTWKSVYRGVFLPNKTKKEIKASRKSNKKLTTFQQGSFFRPKNVNEA